MGCAGCSVKSKDGTPQGCRSNGSCGTSGCNRLNTFDWLATQEVVDVNPFDLVEVSFKNGSRKGFYINQRHLNAVTGDMIVVEGQNGYDVGRISLSGDLVRLQMKKKRAKEDHVVHKVLRHANQRDLEKLDYARSQEIPTMIRARAIARSLDVDMKVGDVEFQGDNRKATFYYTAEGRIDFRELIRHFAKDFKVKVEMRQIGARQESAKIGGIGSCGRELCCSTWLSDFKSVSTAAARYQNLAINQAKLSGQCGRLKCCLNFELDSYMDALKAFPKNTDRLKTQAGIANLVKTDIFKGIMYFAYHKDGRLGKFYPLEVEQVKKIKAMNAREEFPLDLMSMQIVPEAAPVELDFESVNDVIELPPEERRRGRGRGRSRGNRNNRPNRPDNKRSDTKRPDSNRPDNRRPDAKKTDDRKPSNRRNDDRKTGPKPDDNRPNNRRGRSQKPANEGDKPTTDKPRNKRPQGSRPANKPDNQQGDKSANKPTNQGKPRPTDKPVDKTGNKPASQQTNKSANQQKPTNKPIDKPTAKPVVNKTVDKPVAPKPADKPVVDKTAGNAAKLALLNKKKNKSKSNKNRRGGKPKGNDNNGGDAS
ncbi:MAG: cell fate regulator YaaT (PSP1 superfamily) [Paraglaciecola sp.]|jgi:cell fate regulator YaaT (PSP1 superfamily)